MRFTQRVCQHPGSADASKEKNGNDDLSHHSRSCRHLGWSNLILECVWINAKHTHKIFD